MLELGKLIVHELELDRDGDTLARWMAHYIAQLVTEAEGAPKGAERREKEASAAQIISKLWSHRSQYQNRINPLSDLQPIIEVLRSLDPSQSSWTLRYKLDSASPIQALYDTFQRLVISTAALQEGGPKRAKQAVARARATSKFQSESEQEFLLLLNRYLSDTDDASQDTVPDPAAEPISEIDYAHSLVAEARTALDRISAELDDLRKAPTDKPKRRPTAKKAKRKR